MIAPRDARYALKLLAASRDGYTEAVIRAQGFTAAELTQLVSSGLLAVHVERIEDRAVRRYRIADIGWLAV
jgi:hypothetical protein